MEVALQCTQSYLRICNMYIYLSPLRALCSANKNLGIDHFSDIKRYLEFWTKLIIAHSHL